MDSHGQELSVFFACLERRALVHLVSQHPEAKNLSMH
jgi:hypothetical protein